MLDAKKVQWAIKSGLSAICAQCLHYWAAQQHIPDDDPAEGHKPVEAHCPRRDCGGPQFDLVFPKYEGPLAGRLATICYICGDEPDAMVEMHGRGHIGVCKKHLPSFREHLRKPNAPPPKVRERVVPLV